MKRLHLTPGAAVNARIILASDETAMRRVEGTTFEIDDRAVIRLLTGAVIIGDLDLVAAIRNAQEQEGRRPEPIPAVTKVKS